MKITALAFLITLSLTALGNPCEDQSHFNEVLPELMSLQKKIARMDFSDESARMLDQRAMLRAAQQSAMVDYSTLLSFYFEIPIDVQKDLISDENGLYSIHVNYDDQPVIISTQPSGDSESKFTPLEFLNSLCQ